MKVSNEIVFDNIDASTSHNSSIVSMNQVYGWSIQFAITGSPVGSLKAQVSDDKGSTAPYDANSLNVTNWSDLQDSTIAVSGAGTPGINFNGIFYNWLRFVYTSTSGTGNITARLNTKGV